MSVTALGVESVAPLWLGSITNAIVSPTTGFPSPSLNVAVSVEGSPGFKIRGDAIRTKPPGAPDVNATFTVAVMLLAVAVTMAVPVVVVLVNVTSAIPLALVIALGADNVPSVAAKFTVTPCIGFPPVSLRVARISDVLVPLATRVVGLAVSARPPVTVAKTGTSINCVKPPAVTSTRATPSTRPAIRDVVTVPPVPTVAREIDWKPFENVVPAKSVVKTTGVPMGTGLPEVSLTTAVIADELVPSAEMLAGLAVSTMEPTETVPSLIIILSNWVTPPDSAVIVATPPVTPAIREVMTVPVVPAV